VLVVALARIASTALRNAELSALPILLVVKVCFLLAFFVLVVALGPFADGDAPRALDRGLRAVG
jgi:hypothetical protein